MLVSTLQLLIVCLTVLLVVMAVTGRKTAQGGTPVFAGLSAGQDVVVHIADGQSVRGSILRCDHACLLLTGAVLLAGGAETKMGGVVRIPCEGVALIQEL